MAGLGDLFGKHGVIESLVVWGMLQQILGAAETPFLTVLQQGQNQAHPELALPAQVAAEAYVRDLLGQAEAIADAEKNGISAARFAVLVNRARVRIGPADVAEAILRSYMNRAEGEAEVRPQGITPRQLDVLTQLAGDAIGPQDAARALLRGLIPLAGRGPGSVSFEQAIAESRLHDKYAPIVRELARVLASPAELAEGVIRNFIGLGEAETEAARQGVDGAVFGLLRHLAGDAPGPQQLAEALRRGAIQRGGTGPGSTSFLQGIAEGRLADKWAPVIEALARIWPTPVDALDAQVKGQLDAQQGRQLYERLGGDPQFHDWLLATIGDSPTPLEAADMAARGIITEHGLGPAALSFDQAVKESRYRDKWGPAYRELSRHIPPPSTVVTMLAHRAVSETEARTLLRQSDVEPAVADAYVAEADYEAISDYRGLTQSAVIDMYVNHLIGRAQAAAILDVLHVSAAAAGLLLDYADLRYLIDSINRSVQRIAALFTGRKISAQTARAVLLRLDIPPATVDDILTQWQLQAAADVKTLTATQIVDAFYYEIMTPAESAEELQAIGYTEYDSWVLLSLKVKRSLPGKPARTVAPPPGAVIPGTT